MARKIKNDNTPGSNELQGTLSRVVRLLEFLRENTDEKHPISQAEILKEGGDDHTFGAKGTIRKYIPILADTLNIDGFNAPRPAEERRLKFKGSDRYYDKWGEERNVFPPDIRNIYYNHVFTEDELTAIINALYTSKAVSPTDAETIIQKLIKNLASTEHYKKPAYELDFSEPSDGLTDEDRARLAENIAFIQRAISEGYQIKFEYNRDYKQLFDKGGKTKSFGKTISGVSPYHIMSDKGRLFLFGGYKGELSSYRVDKISEITYAGKGKYGRIESQKDNSVPEKMDEEFKVEHMNGAYGKDCRKVTFKWSYRNKDGELVCTALTGQFGNAFTIDSEGEVTVTTSLFGMKIFALQYADSVEVTAPPELVKEIAKTVRGLRDKYLTKGLRKLTLDEIVEECGKETALELNFAGEDEDTGFLMYELVTKQPDGSTSNEVFLTDENMDDIGFAVWGEDYLP